MRPIADIVRKAVGLFATKNPAYQIRHDSVVCSLGESSEEKIRLADIVEWIDHNDPWVCWVTIRLNDGSEVVWRDADCQLEQLLYSVASDKVRVETPISEGSAAPQRAAGPGLDKPGK